MKSTLAERLNDLKNDAFNTINNSVKDNETIKLNGTYVSIATSVFKVRAVEITKNKGFLPVLILEDGGRLLVSSLNAEDLVSLAYTFEQK